MGNAEEVGLVLSSSSSSSSDVVEKSIALLTSDRSDGLPSRLI